MRGGRPFTRRPRAGDGDYGGGGGGGGGGSKFRGSNNSYRDNSSGGGRFNDQNNGRRFGGGNDNFGKNNSGRSRSRYDRRSPDRFSSRNDSRDDSAGRKRPRHDGNSSRRDFGGSLSHNRHHSNGDGGRGSSNRPNRRPSPLPKPSASVRHGMNDKGSSQQRMKEKRPPPPSARPARKFPAKGSIRDKGDAGRRAARRSLLVRSNILRRRDAVRRAKLMRSSLKKRDAAVKNKAADGEIDDKLEKKIKTENSEEKSIEKDGETIKKKAIKKDPADENDDNADIDNDELGQEINNDDETADNNNDENVADQSAENPDGMDIDKIDDDKDSKKRLEEKDKRKKFVRLLCVHCRVECATFRDYNKHLHSRGHKSVLGRYGLRQKTRLARMRLAQRNAQRQLEEESKDTEKHTPQFCLLCRLNYRSPKEDHQASEAHRKMKQFLMPYCETCGISFKSPMAYEIHRCSLEHLRRKAKKTSDKESDIEDNEDTELQVDLDSFLTVDSVGDVDGSEFSLNEESDDNSNEKPIKPQQTTSEKSHVEINVGNEHVKKVEVMYCELCRYYLPHLEDPEAALQKHCGTRNHLRAYLRYKENQSLKITAEMIHRRDHKEKHSNKDSKSTESDVKREGSVAKTDDETTDKVWEDADKDCDQLEQANIENNNEDEDDASVERYDRFKNSEKTEDDEADENDDNKDAEISKADAIDQNGIESHLV